LPAEGDFRLQLSGGAQASDDVALMQRIAAGEQAALRTLYDRHSGVVFAICLRVLRDRNEAEQTLIDVFAEIWEQSGRFDSSRGTPVSYIALLARSRAIDRVRARKKDATTSLDVVGPTVAESDNLADPLNRAVADERKTIVAQALSSLDANQRQVVELAFYDGLSHSEIAAKLNKPLGTVKTHIRQGLIRMRDLLRTSWEGAGSQT
jgi:RNA polymerase sigma-70 factor (ECF subfamily)